MVGGVFKDLIVEAKTVFIDKFGEEKTKILDELRVQQENCS